MIASELFTLIRATLDLKLGGIRDNGTVSIAIYPNDLVSICVWGGEGKTRRLELVYSTEMNMGREVGGEDWVPHVIAFCEWEARRK